MSGQPKPDWYDDGKGQERWWDGRAWTAYTRPRSKQDRRTTPIAARSAVPADASEPDGQPKAVAVRPRHGFRTRTIALSSAATALLGLVIGMGVGGGGASNADPTTTSAYSTMRSQLSAALTERDALRADASATDAREKQVSADRAALTAAQADLTADQASLAKTRAALKKRAAKLDQQESVAAKPATTTVKTPTGSDTSADESSVYYKNCAAARAAGAAPVHRGDPGYASHLDRDDDGVGCE